jgi:hypothetical protein
MHKTGQMREGNNQSMDEFFKGEICVIFLAFIRVNKKEEKLQQK